MSHKRVMIVEDEGLIANDIAGQLQKCGYEPAAICSSGEEAIAAVAAGRLDLVLMDIRLKGELDGIEAARRIRAEFHLPVIFLTSHADADTLSRAKMAEPFGYLIKPFRALSLSGAIEMALYKHHTERIAAEREAWLTTVLQSTAEPTIVTDAGGAIQFLNTRAEELLGRAFADIAGTPWDQVTVIQDASGTRVDDLLSLATLRMSVVRFPAGSFLWKSDGQSVAVEGEVAPSLSKGNIAGAVITLRDVSQRNRAETEVHNEQKMLALERLGGELAHDFNNLLTVIVGHASELAETVTNPDQRVSIQAIREAAQSAGEITHQLLALSRRQILGVEVIQVKQSIERMARMLGPSLGRGIRLHLESAADTGCIRINPAHFDQVVLNIVLNARDAMPEGGSVTVETSNFDRQVSRLWGDATERFVRVTITDSGEGILPEAQDHLFEPFFTTKPDGKGSGLGLAIVYGILKDCGGEISVRSTPGQGACFEILIPRSDEAQNPVPAEQHAFHAPGPCPKTILLVEEQAAVRGVIHNYFEQEGFNLIGAADAPQALQLAELYEGQIDVMISDELTSEIDGISLSRQIAAARPNMKVVFLSGQPASGLAAQNPPIHSTILRKPFALPSLLETVQALTA